VHHFGAEGRGSTSVPKEKLKIVLKIPVVLDSIIPKYDLQAFFLYLTVHIVGFHVLTQNVV
jgi:hypothetical protein